MQPAPNHHPFEIALDTAAAAALAAALAFAGSTVAGLSAAGIGLTAFIALFVLLYQVAPDELPYVLPAFALPDTEAAPDEFLLTADMVVRPLEHNKDELILDDMLAEIGPESRVERLFGPRHMPTAGGFQASIDRHLHPSWSVSTPPDASQALSDALAQLRRSLH